MTDLEHINNIGVQFNITVNQKNSLVEEQEYEKEKDVDFILNENGRITYLKINSKIAGFDLNELSLFSDLETLKLFGLGIDDISFVNSFKNLVELDISNNSIKDVSALSNMKNLTNLNLSRNLELDVTTLKKLIKIEKLILRGCNLTNIEFLKPLINLKELELIKNEISDLSPLSYLNKLSIINLAHNSVFIIKPLLSLNNLKSLWLIGNQINDYSLLKNLKQLRSISLGENNISDISFLKGLINLRVLYLHDNKISDITSIGYLPELTDLNLTGNEISDILPLKKLKNLKDLNLQLNPIRELPYWIVDFSMEIEYGMYGLGNNKISLFNESLKNPPIQIIKQGKEALIRYFDKIAKEGSELIYEVKLTLVGEGSAGKTSLINRLLKKNAALPKQNKRTRGIKIKDWNFKRTKKKTHIAHIWDFGGQDVYYPVHRFFITENSLFLLLASTRQTHHNFDYWIPTIYQFGGNSPIILGQTCHDGNKIAWNDLGGFLGNTDFNIIKTQELPYFELNLPQNNEGLDVIKELIINQITNLPHYGREVPKSWALVRQLLDEESKKVSCISFEKFKEICVNSNPDSFSGPDDFIDCCRFLHDIGVVLWYSINSELKNWVVLEPQWAMNAVYRIIDDQEIQSRRGNILYDDFVRLWNESQYVDKHNVLKKMLEVFKIAFPKKHKQKDYIIPARLTSMPTNKKWNSEELCLRLEYRYEFMPRGMVNQLSAELSRYITSDNEVWNNAVNFSFLVDKAFCQVEEDFYNRKLIVKSAGPEARSLIILVMDALQNITDGYKGVSPEIYVPCICGSCLSSSTPETFLYNKLNDWSRKRSKITCNESGEELYIQELLYKVGLKTPLQNLKGEMVEKENNKKIFVSYSKFDEDYLQDFEDHLITLKDDGLLTFNCREIKFGTEWDKQIKKEIEECDIMVCLVSVKFLNTDYIKRVEIKNAINQGKMIIPIVIKPCDWESSSIGKFQATQRGKVLSLDNNMALVNKIKESTEIERAAFWTAIIKEFRRKIFSNI